MCVCVCVCVCGWVCTKHTKNDGIKIIATDRKWKRKREYNFAGNLGVQRNQISEGKLTLLFEKCHEILSALNIV